MQTQIQRRAITDHGSAVLPRFVPLSDIEALRQAGIAYPETVDGWRWLFRHRAERGMEHVFKRIGKRRILVDVEAFNEAVQALGI